MSQIRTTSTNNSLSPLIFLIAITALLVVIFLPPVVRTKPLSPEELAAAEEAQAVAQAAALDTASMDHLTLMAMGLEEVPASSVNRGQRLFSSTCTPCHGFDAKGLEGLGKTLIGSDFVNRMNDDEFVAFLRVGRLPSDPLNTTGQTMPGQPGFPDTDLHAIVDYVRSLNGATVVDDSPAEASSGTTMGSGFTPPDLSALDTSGISTGSASGSVADLTAPEFVPLDVNALDASVLNQGAAIGEFDVANADAATLYQWSCAGCHGEDAAGIPNLPNSNLLESDFDDAAMFALLTELKPIEAEMVFTHPIRGGYPELNDEQINAVIAYLRELAAQ